MVEDYKIPILKVEPIELVASAFGIHYIIVDNKSGALGVVGDALTDLTVRKMVSGLSWRGREKAEGLPQLRNVPNRAELAKEVEQLFRSDSVVEVLDEECAAAVRKGYSAVARGGGYSMLTD